MKIDINGYVRKAHDTAKAHGFHDVKYSDEHLLCLIVSELMEAVEADRQGRRAAVEMFEDAMYYKRPTEAYEAYIKGSIEEELADTTIRIFDLIGEKYGSTTSGIGIYTKPDTNKTFTENAYFFIGLLGAEQAQLVECVLYLYEWANLLDFDLDWHIKTKMRYNDLRPRLHGKKY